MEERVREFLRQCEIEVEPVPLEADASDRRYYRLEGSGLVLMVRRDSFLPSRDPYCLTTDLMAALGVRVPRIEAADGRRGLLLVEDCGDELMASALPALGEEERGLLYDRALEILLRIEKGTLRLHPGIPAGSDRLSPERLEWELLFFHRHWIRGLRGIELGPSEEDSLRRFYAKLAWEVWSALPPVMSHRDYHARNILLHGGEMVVVDHQDARWGPPLYDLASLARDPYVELPAAEEERLINAYARAKGADPEELGPVFERTALQRNLKAAGTYAFQVGAMGRDLYRPSLAPTLAHAERALRELRSCPVYAGALNTLRGHSLLKAP
jgi:aminoglycoside/choline kinase family phosphotransferase